MNRDSHSLTDAAKSPLAADRRAPEKAAAAVELQLSHGAVQRAMTNPDRLTPGDVIALQRTIGNAAVQRMLAGRASSQTPAAPLAQSERTGAIVRPKLTVGPVGDKYEQAADRVAKAAVSIPAPVQRTADRDDLDELQLQPTGRQSGAGGFEVKGDFANRLSSSKGGGAPLPGSLRTDFEPKFGADFGRVRIHTDARSDQLNRAIQAKAFTAGQDVFFRQGAYAPGSRGGQELIAHELTHVVQQNGEAVQRQEKRRETAAQQKSIVDHAQDATAQAPRRAKVGGESTPPHLTQSKGRWTTKLATMAPALIQRVPQHHGHNWLDTGGDSWFTERGMQENDEPAKSAWKEAAQVIWKDILKSWSSLQSALENVNDDARREPEIAAAQQKLVDYDKTISYKEADRIRQELQEALSSVNTQLARQKEADSLKQDYKKALEKLLGMSGKERTQNEGRKWRKEKTAKFQIGPEPKGSDAVTWYKQMIDTVKADIKQEEVRLQNIQTATAQKELEDRQTSEAEAEKRRLAEAKAEKNREEQERLEAQKTAAEAARVAQEKADQRRRRGQIDGLESTTKTTAANEEQARAKKLGEFARDEKNKKDKKDGTVNFTQGFLIRHVGGGEVDNFEAAQRHRERDRPSDKNTLILASAEEIRTAVAEVWNKGDGEKTVRTKARFKMIYTEKKPPENTWVDNAKVLLRRNTGPFSALHEQFVIPGATETERKEAWRKFGAQWQQTQTDAEKDDIREQVLQSINEDRGRSIRGGKGEWLKQNLVWLNSREVNDRVQPKALETAEPHERPLKVLVGANGELIHYESNRSGT